MDMLQVIARALSAIGGAEPPEIQLVKRPYQQDIDTKPEPGRSLSEFADFLGDN